MARKLPTLPTQGPSRGVPRTSGSLSTLTLASFARLFGDSASPAMSGTRADRSRMRPSLSTAPGFSRPAAPKRTSFIVFPFWAIAGAGERGALLRIRVYNGMRGERASERAGERAAVEQQVLPGDVGGMGGAQECAGRAEFI